MIWAGCHHVPTFWPFLFSRHRWARSQTPLEFQESTNMVGEANGRSTLRRCEIQNDSTDHPRVDVGIIFVALTTATFWHGLAFHTIFMLEARRVHTRTLKKHEKANNVLLIPCRLKFSSVGPHFTLWQVSQGDWTRTTASQGLGLTLIWCSSVEKRSCLVVSEASSI